jgi:hypothetical protein
LKNALFLFGHCLAKIAEGYCHPLTGLAFEWRASNHPSTTRFSGLRPSKGRLFPLHGPVVMECI